MLGLRRNPGQGDGPTARFLYAILRQLDTRSIDWNGVADDIECTNGHAARMRFSRFRQHMEGPNLRERACASERRTNKKQRRKKTKNSNLAAGRAKSAGEDEDHESDDEENADMTRVTTRGYQRKGARPIKDESSSDQETPDSEAWVDGVAVKDEPDDAGVKMELMDSRRMDTEIDDPVKSEPEVKSEPQDWVSGFSNYDTNGREHAVMEEGSTYGQHGFGFNQSTKAVPGDGFGVYESNAGDLDASLALDAEIMQMQQLFNEASEDFNAGFLNYPDDFDLEQATMREFPAV